MKKILFILTIALTTAITTTCFAYVMNGQGACSKCGCSGFYPRSQGFSNMCNCGHWESDHNR